jgi:hypothetical protein
VVAALSRLPPALHGLGSGAVATSPSPSEAQQSATSATSQSWRGFHCGDRCGTGLSRIRRSPGTEPRRRDIPCSCPWLSRARARSLSRPRARDRHAVVRRVAAVPSSSERRYCQSPGELSIGGEKSGAPRGANESLYDYHLRRFDSARKAMRDALENARADRLAVQLGRGPAHGLVPETVEWRVAIGTDPGSEEEVHAPIWRRPDARS